MSRSRCQRVSCPGDSSPDSRESLPDRRRCASCGVSRLERSSIAAGRKRAARVTSLRGRALAVAAAGALLSTQAPAADSLGEAVRDSTWLLDWRLRQETVEQGGFANDANAVTSRLRAGLETAPLGATRMLVEAVGVADIRDDYNSTTNGNTAYPVVADPGDLVAINRFAFINESLRNTTWTIGRQRNIHDNARFVGNVGWRQNEQTYDAVRMQYAGSSIEAELTYAAQVNRIFGPDSPAGRWSGDVVMAQLAHAFSAGKLTGFQYSLDIDEAPALSTRTAGLRFAGSTAVADLDLTYLVGIARQADAGANPASFSETYYVAEGGVGLARLEAEIGYELLGGNGTSAVTTPLATLHAFQGWADRFLATPARGLADGYAKLGYGFGAAGPFTRLDLTAVYHAFSTDAGSADLGNETDLSLVARTERLALTLKYASFDGDAPLADADKAWLSLEYSW